MQSQTNKYLPWIVCLSCGLFFFYEFIQMLMPNSLAPDLMREFHVTGNKLGLLAASYFDANVIFLLPAGLILDRFSTKKIVLVTLGICTIGTLGFAASQTIGWAAFFRFFTGIGSAFCFLGCMRLSSIWFHESRLALVTGLIMTMAFLGGTIAQTPMTILIHHLGWRGAVYCDAALGVLIFFVILAFVKDYPSHEVELKEKRRLQLQALGFWASIKHSYGNLQNWLTGISTSFMNLPVYILGGIWGSIFLTQTEEFSRTQSATITSMILIGTLLGSPSVGWISDRLKQRKLPIFLGAFISLFLILLIVYGPHFSFITLCALFLLLGLISSTQILAYPLVAEKNRRMLTATAVSVVSLNVIGGGAIFQPVVGWLLDKNWDGIKINHVPIYSIHDYHSAFMILPLGFIIAMVLLLFIKESHGKQKQ